MNWETVDSFLQGKESDFIAKVYFIQNILRWEVRNKKSLLAARVLRNSTIDEACQEVERFIGIKV